MTLSKNMRIHKLDENGNPVWYYDGIVKDRSDTHVVIEAYFQRDDYIASYHTFRKGDRMLEWFYTDRWYNVFEIYDVDDGHLKGWYCNITRPTTILNDSVFSDDLALDLMVYPDGRYLVLDEDEFDALELDIATQRAVWQALEQLIQLVKNRQEMFEVIKAKDS